MRRDARSPLPESLWLIIEPMLPPVPPKPKGGRPSVSAHAALTGILFVLRTGIPWEMLPAEMGCGSGVTCWRRLRDWQADGVWNRLHRELLRQLHDADRIDWSRACMDSSSIAAKKGGVATGPNPTDRGRPGTKRHLITDRRGIPLAFLLTGANVHGSMPFDDLLEAVPHVAGKRGRPRRRPDKLHADKAYDHRRCRRACLRRRIKPRIAWRGVETSQKLGHHRCVIERSFAWFNKFRQHTIRYERRLDIHHAFTSLACSLICMRALAGRF
ncbi:IS5 family transposase [Limobrevibacterium gyesilva]|uniref:IS5 family transposase n=1 Tax=Limobrevibacterium gyesilva TaxID=2991712 RepID=A0AA41YJP5_9PROT|nr:IS5 family transposase [Limobrevibacterium gyesilva]MCW3474951.1 IS5 family transposase [Limobrevibacterium gyesilva]